MRFPPVLFAASIIAIGAVPLRSQEPDVGTRFEALLTLRSVGGFAVSPDGRDVVYEVRSTDWKENGYHTDLWLARAGAPGVQLTRSAKGSSSPR